MLDVDDTNGVADEEGRGLESLLVSSVPRHC